MTALFSYKDGENYKSSALTGLDVSSAAARPQAILLRLLSGTCLIQNNITGQELSFTKNYFIDGTDNTECSVDFLDSFQEGLNSNDYNSYLLSAPPHNKIFFTDILNEMAVCIFAAKENRFTESFLHLYRAYERLSYGFPLIYAATNSDYLGSFRALQEWIAKSNPDQPSGELAFLKKFITTIYNENELKATADIDIIGSEQIREVIFNTISRTLLGWKSPGDYEGNTSRPDKISIPFSRHHELIINARNRYFHLSSGRPDNLKQEQVVDSNLFFSTFIHQSISYVAKLFHDTLVHSFSSSS